MDEIEILPELVEVNMKAQNKEEVFAELSDLLNNNGFVKESYLQAITEREKVYPTGLKTAVGAVAIPHTDTEHVLKPGIAVGVLESPVTFGLMGSEGETVDVNVVFMLAITDPKMQVDLLGSLTQLFQDNERMTQLSEVKDKDAVVKLLRSFFTEKDDA